MAKSIDDDKIYVALFVETPGGRRIRYMRRDHYVALCRMLSEVCANVHHVEDLPPGVEIIECRFEDRFGVYQVRPHEQLGKGDS